MYFKIVEPFGPKNEEKWENYLKWRELAFSKFDSVDHILRPDLFEPESAQDWDNCVCADYKLNLITNLEYAKKINDKHPDGVLIGVEIELEKDVEFKYDLLGYDIVDEYSCTSLLTNWGKGFPFIDNEIMTNGLLKTFESAVTVRDRLHSQYKEDSHARHCTIWAIYQVNHLKAKIAEPIQRGTNGAV